MGWMVEATPYTIPGHCSNPFNYNKLEEKL